jgi:hypothetical protein
MFSKRITMNIFFLGIVLPKNVFQFCGLNQAGKRVYSKRTARKKITPDGGEYSGQSARYRSIRSRILLAA